MRRNLWIIGSAFLAAGAALWAAVPAGAVERESACATARVVEEGEYRFLHENQVFAGSLESPRPVGTTVEVRFDPADPTRNHLSGDPLGDSGNRVAAVAGAFALAIGLGFLVGAARFRYLVPVLLIVAGCRKPPPPPPAVVTLQLLAPTGPMEVREGDAILVVARQDPPVLAQVWLERQGGERSLMTRKDSSTFEYKLTVDRTMSIRASGPPETPWIEIRATERPRIRSVKAHLAYPKYLEWPDAVRTLKDLGQGVPIGTVVKLEVDPPGARVRVDGAEGAQFTVSKALHRGDVSIEGASETFEARGIVDQPPTLRLVQPNRDLLVTPDAKIPVEVETQDDFGVREVVVVVTRKGQPLVEKKIRGREILELPGAAVRDRLVLTFVVRDGLQETSSRELHLRVANREEAISTHDSARASLRKRILEQAEKPNEELVKRLIVDIADLRREAEMNGFLDDALKSKLANAEDAVRSAIDAMKKGEEPVVGIALEKAAQAIE